MITFRIHPGLNNYMATECESFYEVRIYKTRSAMWRGFSRIRKANCLTKIKPRFGGCEMGINKTQWNGRKWILLPDMGYIFLSMNQLDSETVTHEATHAAINYVRRMCPRNLPKRDSYQGDNETLAHTVGTCCQQMLYGLHKAKLLNPLRL